MNINLVVDGKSYPIAGAIARCTLNDAIALKLQTGMGMKTINEGIVRMNSLPGGFASPDVFEDVEHINVLRAMVWAARRQAGENLTVEEANDFSWNDSSFVVLDDDGNEITGDDDSEDGTDGTPDPTQDPVSTEAERPDEEPTPASTKIRRSGRTTKTSASKS